MNERPSYPRTTEQGDYARVVATALSAPGPPLLLHGGAGLGKTRAYLVEALRYAAESGCRVLLSTATTQLVEQIVRSDDLHLALALAGKPLTVERYLSQRQFVSPERAAIHGIEAEIGDSTDEVLARSGVDLDPASICINSRCKYVEREPYIAQKARCATAGVVVTTHAALLLDWRTGGRLIDTGSFEVIIVDEADRLPAAASLQLDAAVSDAELAFLKVDPRGEPIAVLTAALASVQKALGKPQDPDVRDDLQRLRANLADMLQAEVSPVPWRNVGRTAEGFALRVRSPARVLAGLWERERVVLTSGTLAVNGRFDDFRHAIGLEASHPASTVIEPRRHGTLLFHLADRSVPTPFDDEARRDNVDWLDYVASGVRAALQDSERVLVLTTSFTTGLAITSRLTGLPVFAHQPGERLQAALSRYQGGAFISPAAWEGLDTDQGWQDIVIPRIPYPRRDGVLDLHFLTAQAQAARRLTQGLARGLRRPDQECHAWILDPRFPLPAAIVNRGEATQQAAAQHLRLIEAIPERFRRGLRATFDKAEIFKPFVPSPAGGRTSC